MKTFIIADLKFFNDDQRLKYGSSSFEEMNEKIIKNWNMSIAAEDNVIVLGEMGGGEKEQLKELLNKLNGHFTLISKESNQNFSEEEWNEIGIENFWNVPIYFKWEDKTFLYFSLKISNEDLFNGYDLIVVDSHNPFEGMVKGKMLSVDALKWDYTPIDTENLWEIYNNMKEFESMETTEHRSEIKEEGEE